MMRDRNFKNNSVVVNYIGEAAFRFIHCDVSIVSMDLKVFPSLRGTSDIILLRASHFETHALACRMEANRVLPLAGRVAVQL